MRSERRDPIPTETRVRTRSAGASVRSAVPRTASDFRSNHFRRTNFSCVLLLANHCASLAVWEDRIIALAIEFAGRGAAFVAVSCGNPVKYPADDFAGMRHRAREKQYPFPYLFDEDRSVARAVGATISPEALVFDHDRTLRYRGAIAGRCKWAPSLPPYLRDAIER